MYMTCYYAFHIWNALNTLNTLNALNALNALKVQDNEEPALNVLLKKSLRQSSKG